MTTAVELGEALMAVSSTWLQAMERQLVFSTIAFVFVALVLQLVPRRWAAVRYALWWLVLLRLILPTGLSADFSLRPLFSGLGVPVISPLAGPSSSFPSRSCDVERRACWSRCWPTSWPTSRAGTTPG